MYYMKVWKYINEIAKILPKNGLIHAEINIFKHRIMLTYEYARIISLIDK